MLTYDMTAHKENPLYVHLYRCIKRDIESGVIAAHEKLPSKRALARNLGVGVITVEAAYAQLIAEGYVYAECRRGYFACDVQPLPDSRDRPRTIASDAHETGLRTHPTGARAASNPARRAAAAQSWKRNDSPAAPSDNRKRSNVRFDLTLGSAAEDAFPFSTWAKALRDTLSLEPRASLLASGDPRGTERLRHALCEHLRRTRNLIADPECIVVGAGAQVLYNLIVQLLDRPQRVALEDPGYARLTHIYEANGVETRHIGLDGGGMDVEALRASGAELVHVTPSHQFPTGATMPASRRYELLAWACESPGRYIVEDDYDCEFRLAGKPLPTLQSIDESERVIYANTFAKTLGPSFRIAYLVLPAHLAHAYREKLGFYSCTVPVIDQLALARFMEQGDFERFVNRTKTRCRAVRDALIAALEKTPAAKRIAYENIDSGLHFVLRVDAKDDSCAQEHRLSEGAARATSTAGARNRRHDGPVARIDADSACVAERRSVLEERIAASLMRQDVAVEPLSRHRAATRCNEQVSGNALGTLRREDGALDERSGRIACRFALSCAALPKQQARAAAEATYRGIAPFL